MAVKIPCRFGVPSWGPCGDSLHCFMVVCGVCRCVGFFLVCCESRPCSRGIFHHYFVFVRMDICFSIVVCDFLPSYLFLLVWISLCFHFQTRRPAAGGGLFAKLVCNTARPPLLYLISTCANSAPQLLQPRAPRLSK